MAEKGGGKKLFSAEYRPKKLGNVGRPKNVFGPLAKEDNLTNDDIKKICKNLLKCDPNNLSKVVAKYPTVLTVTLANMLTQDMKGRLTGRMEPTGRMLPTGAVDKAGNMITEPEFRPERERSFETVQYMIERCFGKPIQTDIILTNISEESELRIVNIFSETFDKSEYIEPELIEAKIEYIGEDDE